MKTIKKKKDDIPFNTTIWIADERGDDKLIIDGLYRRIVDPMFISLNGAKIHGLRIQIWSNGDGAPAPLFNLKNVFEYRTDHVDMNMKLFLIVDEQSDVDGCRRSLSTRILNAIASAIDTHFRENFLENAS